MIRGHKRLYASSLAFKTLLALVPALALVMAVLASDGMSHQREQLLDQIVDAIYPVQTQSDNSLLDPDEPKNLQQLNQVGKHQIRISVKKFASHAQKVGLIGFAGFLVIVFLLLRDVENSFNFLWEVKNGRVLVSQLIRHAAFFLGIPLLAVILLTVKGWMGNGNIHNWFFSTLLPFGGLWAACAWMYHWTPRSNPATYTGAFSPIRDWFAQLPNRPSAATSPAASRFNVKGGRCEACQGDGVIKIEMHFLPDVYVQCDVCQGKRYNRETLEIHYRGKSIADVLEMTVDEGVEFFKAVPVIRDKLLALQQVGLGYIHIGQQATTLVGRRGAAGEARQGALAPRHRPHASTSSTSRPPACISRTCASSSRCCIAWSRAATP